MVDLARIDSGLSPALPCHLAGPCWRVSVERCAHAWLLRQRQPTDPLFPEATRAESEGDRIIAWIAPGTWLCVGPSAPAGHWTDVAARYAVLRVTGEPSGFVTAMTGLDGADIVPGRSLPARMAGLAVLVIPREDHVLILVERGRERYWIAWLARVIQAD